jgi:lysyl-tRNA synthetase class 1
MNWAENHARKIIEKFPNEKVYVCASGITPSGFIHVGNFREYFTVELVANELKKLGKKVRHIHSWDNFDPLRKVPKNIPEEKKEKFEEYIGKCITDIEDPWQENDSYADHFIKIFENEIKSIGCSAEFLYQDKIYRSAQYKDYIKLALNNKSKIIEVYNKFRHEPVKDTWWPVTLWCEKCNKVTDIILDYDGEYKLKYKCKHCGHTGEMDFSKNGNVKLRWRIDWPMRWAYYNEHFEPSGKDHMSAGGSNDMAKILVKEVFNNQIPYTFMYEFIGIKGSQGKMSSSSGSIYTISDILQYYLPEVFRYLYVATKPSSTFSIQLDENIFQVYKEFYNKENLYYKYINLSEEEKKKSKINKDIIKEYELSNIWKTQNKPIQPRLQEFITLNQVLEDNAVDFYLKVNNIQEEQDIKRVKNISKCMKNWVKDLAPEKYIHKIKNEADNNIKNEIISFFENNDFTNGSDYQQMFYEYMKSKNINIKEAFKTFYILLFNKEVGPKFSHILDYFGYKYVYNNIKRS